MRNKKLYYIAYMTMHGDEIEDYVEEDTMKEIIANKSNVLMALEGPFTKRDTNK